MRFSDGFPKSSGLHSRSAYAKELLTAEFAEKINPRTQSLVCGVTKMRETLFNKTTPHSRIGGVGLFVDFSSSS